MQKQMTLSEEEANIIEIYRRVSESGKELIREHAKLMLKHFISFEIWHNSKHTEE